MDKPVETKSITDAWNVTVGRSSYSTWILRVTPGGGGTQERVHERTNKDEVEAVAVFLRACEPACAAAYDAVHKPSPDSKT